MKIIFSTLTPVSDIREAYHNLGIDGPLYLELQNKREGNLWNGRRVITTERTGDYVELMRLDRGR